MWGPVLDAQDQRKQTGLERGWTCNTSTGNEETGGFLAVNISYLVSTRQLKECPKTSGNFMWPPHAQCYYAYAPVHKHAHTYKVIKEGIVKLTYFSVGLSHKILQMF